MMIDFLRMGVFQTEYDDNDDNDDNLPSADNDNNDENDNDNDDNLPYAEYPGSPTPPIYRFCLSPEPGPKFSNDSGILKCTIAMKLNEILKYSMALKIKILNEMK